MPPGGEGLEGDRPYSPWSSLMPTSWFPAAYIADGAFALGAQIYGQDALGLHLYTLAPLYEFTQQEVLGSASYVYNDRHGGFVARSMTVKTRRGGQHRIHRKDVRAFNIDEAAQWVSLWRRLSLSTRWYAGGGAALDRSELHDLGAGTTVPRNERVLGLVAGVETSRTQFLSEGPSLGQQLRLFAETSNGLHGTYTGNFYRGDWRVYLPAGPTVFAMHLNSAYSQPGDEPIQLGGSFSEQVVGFDLPVLNQRQFPLRGYRSGEPQLTGHHSPLGSPRWRTPRWAQPAPDWCRRWSLDAFRLTLFFEAGSAWNDSSSQRYFRRGRGASARSARRLSRRPAGARGHREGFRGARRHRRYTCRSGARSGAAACSKSPPAPARCGSRGDPLDGLHFPSDEAVLGERLAWVAARALRASHGDERLVQLLGPGLRGRVGRRAAGIAPVMHP
jgi:hypothetical protein